MPRTGRIVLTGYPHHVVQRGHDRKAVFAQEADCSRYLVDLKELKEMYEVRVFAYCLMTNHVHLLLQPEGPPARLGATNEGAGSADDTLSQQVRAAFGNFVGKPLQVECCAFGRVPALVLSLH